MKAIRVHQFGGPEVLKLEEIPDPKPAARRSGRQGQRGRCQSRRRLYKDRDLRLQAEPSLHARNGRRRRSHRCGGGCEESEGGRSRLHGGVEERYVRRTGAVRRIHSASSAGKRQLRAGRGDWRALRNGVPRAIHSRPGEAGGDRFWSTAPAEEWAPPRYSLRTRRE